MDTKEKTPKEKYEERKKWFTDRIGKTVFRNKSTCDCDSCRGVEKNGLEITDYNHACYMRDCEGESWMDGATGIRYFDTKEEVVEFESKIKK